MTSGHQTTITVEAALVEIDQRVLRLFAMVSEGLGAATVAFLAGDCGVARQLVAADVKVDSLELAIEDTRPQPSGPRTHRPDQRPFVACGHTSDRSRVGAQWRPGRTHRPAHAPAHGRAAVPPCPWTDPGDGRSRSPNVASGGRRLRRTRPRSRQEASRPSTTTSDDLHVNLSAELAQNDIATSVAIEMGLIARFLERLGDHAVNVARRFGDLCHDDSWERSA